MTDTTTILALVAAGGYALAMGTSAMWLKAASDAQSAMDKLHRHASVHRDLDAVAAAERSRRTAKGTRTRAANRRARLEAKTAELKGMAK